MEPEEISWEQLWARIDRRAMEAAVSKRIRFFTGEDGKEYFEYLPEVRNTVAEGK